MSSPGPLSTPLASLPMSEKQLQDAVLKLARILGYRVYHTFDSRRSNPGFPDLVLVRERLIFAELKKDGKQPTSAQRDWLDNLQLAGQECHVWRPQDWRDGTVEAVLRTAG